METYKIRGMKYRKVSERNLLILKSHKKFTYSGASLKSSRCECTILKEKIFNCKRKDKFRKLCLGSEKKTCKLNLYT